MAIIDFGKTERFTVENGNGTSTRCDILFSHKLKEGMLIVFTDGSKDENNGKIRAFASIYNPDVSEDILLPIGKSDWEFANTALKYIIAREKARARRRDVYGIHNRRYTWRHQPFFK